MDDLKIAIADTAIGKIKEGLGYWDPDRAVARATGKERGKTLFDLAGFARTQDRIFEVVRTDSFYGAVLDAAEGWAAKQIEKKLGLLLEHGINEESLARAIGKRAGIVLRSLHDIEIIKEDLIRAAADEIEKRLSIHFEHVVRTADDLMHGLERRAAAEIEKRVPDLVLHDLFDMATTENDLKIWAVSKIKQRTGIPLRDPTDFEKSKQDILNWAEPEIRRRLNITGSSMGGGLKMTKKAIKNRMAQRRFYEAHGNRKKYYPVMPAQ
ncbi:MAG: hypothetical protein H6R10_591 [Rhodocyclaceae bacterium]|nr:hypothetical protein [Rhodocyclaceae bacterium]